MESPFNDESVNFVLPLYPDWDFSTWPHSDLLYFHIRIIRLPKKFPENITFLSNVAVIWITLWRERGKRWVKNGSGLESNSIPTLFPTEQKLFKLVMFFFQFGTANPDVAPTGIPCGGCGAALHCRYHD